MKRFLVVLLVIAMLLSMALPVMAVEAEETLASYEETVTSTQPAVLANDEFEISFDKLKFASDAKSVEAEAVSYYVSEGKKEPTFTVIYEDDSTGVLPDGISVEYPDGWPDTPGSHTVRAVVGGKFEVTFEATVLADLDPTPDPDPVPETNLTAPSVEIIKDYANDDMLAWGEVAFADYYEIYRATSKTGTYTLIDTTSETVWMNEIVPVGKIYYYMVVAVYGSDPALNSAASNVIAFTGKCATPSVTGSFNVSTGKPVLSWNKVSGAKKYEIYRSTDDGRTFKRLTTTTKTTYTDTKATAGNWYLYRVKAIASKSAYNSEQSYTIDILCYMSRPTLTVTTDAATGKPSLSWKKVSGATTYAVGRLRPDGSVEDGDFDLLVQQKSLTYLDKEAQTGQEYTYVVVAIGKNEDTYSYMSEAKTALCTCARPVLKTDATENGSPVIRWDAVEGAISYEIYRSTSTSASKFKTPIAIVNDLSYVDTSVVAGKSYYYKVVAVAENTQSVKSNYIKATGKCDIPQLSVIAGATGKPVLSWAKVAGAKKYEIWYSKDGATMKRLTTTSKTTYTHTNATTGSIYTYKVKALGPSSNSNGLFCKEQSCNVLCAAPTLSIKVDTATGKPSLNWKKITGATGYAIYRAMNDGAFEYVETVTGISYRDIFAVADQKYSYKVVALGKSAVFNSHESAVKSVVSTCGQPKLTGAVNDHGKPVITWEKVDDAVAYNVYRATSTSASRFKTPIATVTDLSFTDLDVVAGKTFYYKVVAVSENGQSVMSVYVKLTGKCDIPELEVTNGISGKPVLSWNKVNGAKKYEIWRSVDGATMKRLTTTTKTVYTDTKATAGTHCTYKVKALASSSRNNGLFSQILGCDVM